MEEKTNQSNDIDIVALQNDNALLKQQLLERDATIEQLNNDKSALLNLNRRLQLAVGVDEPAPTAVPTEPDKPDFLAGTLSRLFKK